MPERKSHTHKHTHTQPETDKEAQRERERVHSPKILENKTADSEKKRQETHSQRRQKIIHTQRMMCWPKTVDFRG